MSKCLVCNKNDSKYKCPKCKIPYCSLICFKAPAHNHDNNDNSQKAAKDEEPQLLRKTTKSLTSAGITKDKLSKLKPSSQKILQNDKLNGMLSLLSLPQLQIQLIILNKIINDVSLTNEGSAEDRKEIAIKKLETLRMDGMHPNELVEEFCQLFEKLNSNDDKPLDT
ncbi:Hit1 protein [Saccharomycopsis crataegensis]|uniref:Hit1 protein n=1 Tax=Saccharomycopsis crataegensis TaxID=43959 RepID=A0AAV5QPQ8_9ASCO|nr:Hit1 protein [Saccharomycopsis crataegensis]